MEPRPGEYSPVLFDLVRSIVERGPRSPDPIAGRPLGDLWRHAGVSPVRATGNGQGRTW